MHATCFLHRLASSVAAVSLASLLSLPACTGVDDPTPEPSDTPAPTPTPTPTQAPTPTPVPDADADTIPDTTDNCPSKANTNQADADDDGVGDACDPEECDGKDNDGDGKIDEDMPDRDGDDRPDCTDSCPDDAKNDVDGDLICADKDNCPSAANATQSDVDADLVGDACDAESCDGKDNDGDGIADNGFPDTDGDGTVDCLDACSNDPSNDADGDGDCADQDNCPATANAEQTDADQDGLGDVCDPCPSDSSNDLDGDGACADADNCPTVFNDQSDVDSDGSGDACDVCPNDSDNDADLDGICADADVCPNMLTETQMDRDMDGFGDECDACPDHRPDDGDEDGACGVASTPTGTLEIYAVFPDNGYAAVTTTTSTLTPRVFFTEDYLGDMGAIKVRLVPEGLDVPTFRATVSADPEADDRVKYTLPSTLDADAYYCLMVDVDEASAEVPAAWPLHHTACFRTTVPCGQPVNVGQDVSVKKLGSGTDVLKVINTALAADSDFAIVFLLENIATTGPWPSEIDAFLGAFTTSGNDNVLRPEGYASTLPGCSNSSNALHCESPQIIISAYEGSIGVKIYVQNAVITGQLGTAQGRLNLTGFQLEGLLTKEAVERLAAALHLENLSNKVLYDVDSDGDGVKDSATVIIQTVPQGMSLLGSTCPTLME